MVRKYTSSIYNDVISDDSMRHQEGGPREDEEAGDLLTPKGGGGGVFTGDEGVIMQKQRKRGRSFRHQSSPHRFRKMTFECIEVCFQGSVRAFMEVASFVAWVNSIPGPSHAIGIRGVGTKEGPDSQELGNFVTSVLHIEGAPGRWRRRHTGFLQKRCGHRLAKEGAVKRTVGNESGTEEKDFSPVEMLENRITPSLRDVGLLEAPPTIVTSEAEGYKHRPQANCKALRPLPESLQPIISDYSSESLQHPQQRQQHSQLFPPVSADDGDESNSHLSNERP